MTPTNLRIARKSLGLTQHSLAEVLRMGKWGFQSVAKWEKGEVPIPGPAQVAIELMARDAEWVEVERLRMGKLFGWDEHTWRNVSNWAGNDWPDFTGPDHVERRLLLRQRWLDAGGSMDGVTLPPAPHA